MSGISQHLLTWKPHLDTSILNNPQQEVFPLMAWLTIFAFLVVASLLFVVANNQSVAESFALMMRLFLQLGYQLTLRRREKAIQCCEIMKLSELIGSLKLGNVWVFIQLIFGPLWPMN